MNSFVGCDAITSRQQLWRRIFLSYLIQEKRVHWTHTGSAVLLLRLCSRAHTNTLENAQCALFCGVVGDYIGRFGINSIFVSAGGDGGAHGSDTLECAPEHTCAALEGRRATEQSHGPAAVV